MLEEKQLVISQKELMAELEAMRKQLSEVQQEKADLELLLETLTEHATNVESELEEKNSQITQSFNELQEAQIQIERLREQEQKYLESVRRELEIGRKIQTDFLPAQLPIIAGWGLDARFKPARDVAGDFYDAFELPGNRIGFVVADVCDKGVGAALFMALVRSLIRVLAQQSASRLREYKIMGSETHLLVEVATGPKQPPLILPADIVEVLNAVYLTNEYVTANHSQSNMFATLFFGVIDPPNGTISYINGGHDAPIVCGPQGVKGRLTLTGPAVGMMPGVKYKIRQVQLEPGDFLLAFSDGIPEARSPDGKFYTNERLLALLTDYVKQEEANAVELLDKIETEVREHVADAEPSDDITMLAIWRAK